MIEDASLSQVAAIMARRLDFELPDVVVEQVPMRQYPADAMAAHLFGYVGEASDTQIGEGITSGAIVGQSGIERVYNRLLMGQDGARRVVVNSVGREIREIAEIPPVEGRRVQLTIDYDLQKAAEDGFRHAGFNGAALIMDPRNGEVLTYVSLPAYDPNDFAGGIDRATWVVAQCGQAPAAPEPSHPGAVFTGFDLQDRGGDCGARGRARHARLQSELWWRRELLRPLLTSAG